MNIKQQNVMSEANKEQINRSVITALVAIK